MTDFLEFDPPAAYRLTHDRLPATSWFALSTNSVDDFIDAGYATGSTNPPRSLALGINEITGSGYGRQSQSTPAGSGESTTYSQLTWDTGTATDWDSPKTLVLCTTANNKGRALCAWNLTPGGAATDLSSADATVQITPVVAPPSSGGSGVSGYPPAAGVNGFAQGSIADGGTITVPTSSYPGAFAQGYAKGADSSIQSHYTGSFAQGVASASGTILSKGYGSIASGYANGGSISTLGSAPGGFAQGYSVGGSITASGSGAFAQGFARAAGSITAAGFAQGYAEGTDSSLTAPSTGAFAQGSVRGGGTITANAVGAFAQGYARITGSITASAFGSFAQGSSASAGSITSSNLGSFAQGYVGNGTIISQGEGSFAQGYADIGSTLTSSGGGSFAQGYAHGADITASGTGSFAQGSTTDTAIAATASNAAQFGPGTNGQADSLQVGNGGIRLLGKAAAQPQTTFQNGDIWVGDDGHVKIRSNGATISI